MNQIEQELENQSDKDFVLTHFIEEYPAGISSLEFDAWSVENNISCDNSKRRLRELQTKGLIRSEWEKTSEGKRFKRYWYVPIEDYIGNQPPNPIPSQELRMPLKLL